MTIQTLTLTLLFVIIPLALAYGLKLNIEKDILIATIRSIIQLFIVGYVLQYVFNADHLLFTWLMVALIITAATHNARKKGHKIKGMTWKLVLTYITVETLTQGILLGFNITPMTPQYIIPISGMVIGNAMVLSILFLNRFTDEVDNQFSQIELILSLGGTPKQAIHRQLMTSIKASTIPTIENQKTIGLVQLPGMMSGQIIAGADPIQAVQFQLLIVFLLMTTAVLTSVMIGFLVYPTLFNEKMQLITKDL
ncbi:putative ABC transport system permease protein [Pelagirhabdus alkalitolerans]|uniref:Putative ABC transport system permease protein n=1 Tax=Pelagirhabdus alkalitolerans TaxID=1612202 RepID=A0A1G6KNS0_9BACI|nr:iron export ABC transporter permease subunit FetB [Pelagirhabdus alkalitolerans]SDC32185.1 putative ABC transport system permease protein [Pelagirhabdus alkalitolerans]